MLYIIVSICAGVTITLTRLINTSLAGRIGIFQSTLYNYIVGLSVSTCCLLFSGEKLNISAGSLSQVPIWALGGGMLGVIVIAISSYTTPKISAFYFTIIIFIGQLFTGIAIDYFSLDILSAGKIIGGMLVLAGLAWNQQIDRIRTQSVKLEKQ